MSILIFFIILLVLVLAHEFGHFFAAKRFGIRVDEFGFGFPPKLFSKKGKETEYSFNLLPFGGFVKIFGENPDEENISGPDRARSMVNKPGWQQAIVLLSGVLANFILSWLLFSVSLMTGLPASAGSAPREYKLSNTSLVIVSVLPNSPAEKSGLSAGDKILSVKSAQISGKTDELSAVTPENLKAFILSHKNDKIEIQYKHGQETPARSVEVIPVSTLLDGTPGIGISMDEIGVIKLSFFPALSAGLKFAGSTAVSVAEGLYNLITNSLAGRGNLSAVAGPVGLVGIVGEAYRFGLVYLLSFTALISINLAVLNLVPFPALDGGRLLFLLIEKIKGSRLNPKFANTANMVGFALIIILMLAVTYHDIVRLL